MINPTPSYFLNPHELLKLAIRRLERLIGLYLSWNILLSGKKDYLSNKFMRGAS